VKSTRLPMRQRKGSPGVPEAERLVRAEAAAQAVRDLRGGRIRFRWTPAR
jgi:hypothetical protein